MMMQQDNNGCDSWNGCCAYDDFSGGNNGSNNDIDSMNVTIEEPEDNSDIMLYLEDASFFGPLLCLLRRTRTMTSFIISMIMILFFTSRNTIRITHY
mmetsp:Transcript_35921/g.36361  ORF Transcript_35921/g.36361 Transcript_35921/m.36361 type:complete len:97 (+) Transcript_35921:186-476(+)